MVREIDFDHDFDFDFDHEAIKLEKPVQNSGPVNGYNRMMEIQEDLCQCRIIHRERVVKARDLALAAEDAEGVVQIFKAMGDHSRLRILRALEDEEMCVCDLAALLGVSESAVSHQLRLLRTWRLVKNRRQGPVLYYRLADEHVSRLLELALEHVRE